MFSELRSILLLVQVPKGFFCSHPRDAMLLGGYQVFLGKSHQSKKAQWLVFSGSAGVFRVWHRLTSPGSPEGSRFLTDQARAALWLLTPTHKTWQRPDTKSLQTQGSPLSI